MALYFLGTQRDVDCIVRVVDKKKVWLSRIGNVFRRTCQRVPTDVYRKEQ